jgi:hypothetical protein
MEGTGMLQSILASASLAFATMAGIVFGGAPIYGHDWYPFECCARNDCMPAKAVEADGRSGMTVIVGDVRIAIPEGFASRTSLDSRVHVCFRMYPDEMDGNIIITLVCLFLPPQA